MADRLTGAVDDRFGDDPGPWGSSVRADRRRPARQEAEGCPRQERCHQVGSYQLDQQEADPRETDQRGRHGGDGAPDHRTGGHADREGQCGVGQGDDAAGVETSERAGAQLVEGAGPPGDEQAAQTGHGDAADAEQKRAWSGSNGDATRSVSRPGGTSPSRVPGPRGARPRRSRSELGPRGPARRATRRRGSTWTRMRCVAAAQFPDLAQALTVAQSCSTGGPRSTRRRPGPRARPRPRMLGGGTGERSTRASVLLHHRKGSSDPVTEPPRTPAGQEDGQEHEQRRLDGLEGPEARGRLVGDEHVVLRRQAGRCTG